MNPTDRLSAHTDTQQVNHFPPMTPERENAAKLIMNKYKKIKNEREENYRLGCDLLNFLAESPFLNDKTYNDTESLAFSHLFLAARQRHPEALLKIGDIFKKRANVFVWRSSYFTRRYASRCHLNIYKFDSLTYSFVKRAALLGVKKAQEKLNKRINDSVAFCLPEAINYFAGKPSIFTNGFEPYYWLEYENHSDSEKSQIPKDLKEKMQKTLNGIHQNPLLMAQILLDSQYDIYQNSLLIHQILSDRQLPEINRHHGLLNSVCKLLEDFTSYPNLDPALKAQILYKFLDSQYYSSTHNYCTALESLINSPYLDEQANVNVKFNFAYTINLDKYLKTKIEETELIQWFKEFSSHPLLNKCQQLTARYELAFMTCAGKSDILPLEEAAILLKEFWESVDPEIKKAPSHTSLTQSPYYYHTNAMYRKELNDRKNKAGLELARLRTNYLTDIIDDQETQMILLKIKKNAPLSYNPWLEKQALNLLESLYLQKRVSSYQKLTIANNTGNTLHYVLRKHGEKESFTLLPYQRKIYEDLREKGINYVGLKVRNQAEQLLIKYPYMDINTYVACFGSPIKVAVYFEPDASADAQEPTSEMIRDIANLLKEDYNQMRENYPSLNFDAYVKSLGCDLDLNNGRLRFMISQLNHPMRPQQLEKAIQKILNGS